MSGGGGGGGGGGGKEGDWECTGCRNRNYAFRSFCNRCKQPRVLVGTSSDSKWLPRVGDWICSGCTNNNYASREKCKKCGQPKEVAAMPAVAIPGASAGTHPTYLPRAQGAREQMMNVGSFHPSLSFNSSWHLGGADRYGNLHTNPYGFQPTSNWNLGGNIIPGVQYARQMNQIPTVSNDNGWRTGDWMCTCGFHNYSSRVECKKCSAPMPIQATSSLTGPAVAALGSKRVASDEFVHNWDNKRLNAGQAYGLQHPQYETFSSGNIALPANFQMSHMPATPTVLGKGAKQWRDGDWMCSNCNNHNYASRTQCNRCKSERDEPDQPVSVA